MSQPLPEAPKAEPHDKITVLVKMGGAFSQWTTAQKLVALGISATILVSTFWFGVLCAKWTSGTDSAKPTSPLENNKLVQQPEPNGVKEGSTGNKSGTKPPLEFAADVQVCPSFSAPSDYDLMDVTKPTQRVAIEDLSKFLLRLNNRSRFPLTIHSIDFIVTDTKREVIPSTDTVSANSVPTIPLESCDHDGVTYYNIFVDASRSNSWHGPHFVVAGPGKEMRILVTLYATLDIDDNFVMYRLKGRFRVNYGTNQSIESDEVNAMICSGYTIRRDK